MSQFFDNYLTYISVSLPKVEVFATACEALSIVDERKDSAGITSDNYQILPSSNQNIYKNVTKHAKAKQDEKGTYLANGAAAKSGLTKSILDAGWGQFQQMCVAKAEYAGRTVLFVNPGYTSQVCSQCGTVRKKDLSDRWHSCECGCELDRDVNAAINILRLGRSPQVPHSRASGGSLVQAPAL